MTTEQLEAKRASYIKQLEVMSANVQRLNGAIAALNELLKEQEVAQQAQEVEDEREPATKDIRDDEAGTAEDTGGTA